MLEKKFVILAHARCGSTRLNDVFLSQGIKIISEPYNSHSTLKYLDVWGKEGFASSLDLIFSEYDGMKHISDFSIIEQNQEIKNRCNTIFLYRENLLDAAISLQYACITNVWTQYQINQEYGKEKVFLRIDDILFSLKHLKRHFLHMDDNCFVVSYEQIYYGDNQKKLIKDIFDFVGCKIVDLDMIMDMIDKKNKINRLSWKELILNYDDIKDLA